MRPRRLTAPGLYFHITARGNNGQDIFSTDADRIDYLQRMSTIFSTYMVRLLAYCLMTNHIHLLVQDVRGGALRLAMQRLQGGFAQAWNRRHRRGGHVFGDRYHTEPVESDAHLISASCYIHNNPVTGCIVKKAQNYKWSSVGAYLGGSSDIPVSTDFLLEMCGGTQKYAELLETSETQLLDKGERLPDVKPLRGLWLSGSSRFRNRLTPHVERRVERRNRARRPEGSTLESIWVEVSRRTGVSPDDIIGPSRLKKISEARAMLCALARREGIAAVDVAREICRTRSAVVHLARNFDLNAVSRV